MNEKLQAALLAARELLAAGDLAGAKAKRAEAETIIEHMNEAKALEETAKHFQPVRPDLPGTGQGAVPGIVQETAKATPAVAVADDGDADDNLAGRTQKAAYMTRFGDEASIIKSILTDLHGPTYQGEYWAQKAAFNRYIRGGDERLSREDKKRLHTMIMNPKSVKLALDQGLDDLNALRVTMVEAADTLGRPQPAA